MHRQLLPTVCIGLLAGSAISLAGYTSPALDDAMRPPPTTTVSVATAPPVADAQPELVAEAPPLSARLAALSGPERSNAIITVECGPGASPVVLDAAYEAETLWSRRSYEEALDVLEELEASGAAFGIGTSWRTPIASTDRGAGYRDVRIGSARTNALSAALDFDAETGNLLAVVNWGNPNAGWTVNTSFDHGRTWVETYFWSASFVVDDVDAAVVGDYLFIGYLSPDPPTDFRLRRMHVATGTVDVDYPYHSVVTNALGFRDVAIATNADDYDNRVYLTTIQGDDQIRYFWSVAETAETFNEESPTGIAADRNLDMHWNDGPRTSPWFLVVSYLGTDGNIHVLRHSDPDWEDITVGTDAASFADVSISAHADTIIVGYEFPGTNAQGIRYRISYDAGDSWNFGTIANPPADSSGCHEVHITARGGAGTAAIHGEELGATDPVWFTRRAGYDSGAWTSPESVAEHDILTGRPMVMNWIPPLAGRHWGYGAVYVSGENADYEAYFLRVPSNCLADITGPDGPDGNVDALDFLRLISQWGSPCIVAPCDADITGPNFVPDGSVDALDYLMLIGQWGNPGHCPPTP